MKQVKVKPAKVILKSGREKSVLNRHPWVFSGAVAQIPECPAGEIVQVVSHKGETLGSGYLNPRSSIVVRMLSFGNESALDALQRHLEEAVRMREALVPERTDAFRLINSEGDFIPGLIVDRYADLLVLQIGTLGMEKLKGEVCSFLEKRIGPHCIFEKSMAASRLEEGLEKFEGPLLGGEPEPRVIQEHGVTFRISMRDSQKTGFFLDQREMRALVGSISSAKRVLNCFSYTGGFSVYAAKAGAREVESVDISGPALERARENFELNGLDVSAHRFIEADVFERLRSGGDTFDVVVLDPPAFAKKKAHEVQACRGYGEINREAMKLVTSGGILVTSSCSHFVDERLFGQVVFQAARDSGREVTVLGLHRHGFDHPRSIFHPEGGYLKSLILQVR
jgi:23S rRNA (cytosine1962-C5)-methyltransferase